MHAADRGDGSGRSGGQSPVLRQEVSGPREEVDERVLERAGPGQRSPVGGFQMEEGVDGAVRGGGEQTVSFTLPFLDVTSMRSPFLNCKRMVWGVL